MDRPQLGSWPQTGFEEIGGDVLERDFRPMSTARHPHRVTELFAYTFLIRLDRRLAPTTRAFDSSEGPLGEPRHGFLATHNGDESVFHLRFSIHFPFEEPQKL